MAGLDQVGMRWVRTRPAEQSHGRAARVGRRDNRSDDGTRVGPGPGSARCHDGRAWRGVAGQGRWASTCISPANCRARRLASVPCVACRHQGGTPRSVAWGRGGGRPPVFHLQIAGRDTRRRWLTWRAVLKGALGEAQSDRLYFSCKLQDAPRRAPISQVRDRGAVRALRRAPAARPNSSRRASAPPVLMAAQNSEETR